MGCDAADSIFLYGTTGVVCMRCRGAEDRDSPVSNTDTISKDSSTTLLNGSLPR
jgi:hypothetical protein